MVGSNPVKLKAALLGSKNFQQLVQFGTRFVVMQNRVGRERPKNEKIAKLFMACENAVRQASLRKGSSDGSEKVHKCTEGFRR